MKRDWLVLAFVVLFTVLTRLMPHPLGVTPLWAVAFFSGLVFRGTLLWVGVLSVLIGDLALGWVMPNIAGYVVALMMLALGRYRRKVDFGSGASVLGPTVFYVLSNYLVWREGLLYPLTAEGLASCYFAGLPFYMNDLIGTVVYGLALFGLYYWALVKGVVTVDARTTSKEVAEVRTVRYL